LGLSDHSQGHLAVLGAVALGAKAIEKHFTDDTSRVGPDHAFSLDPKSWSLMVSETRTLERCLGDGVKRVEENEIESRIVQRRALRYKSELKSGHVIKSKDLIALRPCPANGIDPYDLDEIVGKTLMTDVKFDQLVSRDDIKNT
jgi:N-acetylneuraminate synthase